MAYDVTSKLTVAMQAVGADKLTAAVGSVTSGVAVLGKTVDVVTSTLKSFGGTNLGNVLKQIDGLTGASTIFTSQWRNALGLLNPAAFAGMVRGVLDGQAALHDLSIQSGLSVAMLGQLKSIGALSGASVESLAGASTKLSKSLATTDEDGKGAALALKALGLNFGEFKKLDADQRMLAVAEAMGKYRDGTEKSAVAQLLFGKTGAELLPTLADLAEEHDKVTEKLTDQEKETARLRAAMSDAWGDNLTKIRRQGEGWKKDMANGLLPVMYEVSETVLKLSGATGGWKDQISQLSKDGSIAEWGRNVVTVLSYIADAGQIVYRVIESLVKGVTGVIAGTASNISTFADVATRIINGDFKGAFQQMQTGAASTKTIMVSAFEDIQDTWSKPLLGAGFRAQFDALKGIQAAAKQTKPVLEDVSKALGIGADQTAKKHEQMMDAAVKQFEELSKAGRDWMRDLQQRNAVLEKTIALGRELTEGEKQQLEFEGKLATGQLVLTAAQKEAAQISLTRNAALAVEKQYLLDTAKANNSYFDSLVKSADSINEQARALEQEAAAFGLSEQAVKQLEIARIRENAATKMQLVDTWASIDPGIALAYLDQADALTRLANAKDANLRVGALKVYGEEWKRLNDQIGDGLADALMRGGDTAADYLKDLFKAMVLKPIVQAVVQPVSGAVAAFLAGGASGGGAGAAGGVNSLYAGANTASMVGSLYTAATGYSGGVNALAGYLGAGSTAGASGASLVYANGVGALGGDSLGALIAANGSWGGVAAGGVAGTTASAGTAASVGATGGAAGTAGAAAGGSSMSAMAALGWAAVVAAVLYAVFGDHTKWSMGSVSEGEFGAGGQFGDTQYQLPYQFGANTEHQRNDVATRTALGGYATSIGQAATQFGGSPLSGLGLSLSTDADREGQMSAIISLLKGGQVIGGTQTGSGAFSGSSPLVAADKLNADEIKTWFSTQLPVIIVQGLQQSDLQDRFDAYFDSVSAGALTADKASQMLQTATAVQQFSTSVAPLGGIFARLQQASVETVADLAKAAGGFDATSQSVAAYYERFYTEAERTQNATDAVTSALAAVGIVMPDLAAGSEAAHAAYRRLVDAQDESTEAGRKGFSVLMANATVFDQLAEAAEAAAEKERKLKEEHDKAVSDKRGDLEIQLLRAMGQETAAVAAERQLELAAIRALDPSLVTIQQRIYDVVDAAQQAERLRSLTSGVDSVVTGFLSGPALNNYFADRILQTLGEAGITGTAAGVLSSTKADVLALWNAVGVDGKEAILQALPMWEQLQDRLLQTSGIAGSVSDLLVAYNEINPAAETLVDKWRKSRQEMQLLQDALDQIDGTPARTALGQIQALIGKRNGLASVQDSVLGLIGDARTSRGDQAAVDYLTGIEANLKKAFLASNDPQIAQQWVQVTQKRIQIQGQLEAKAQQDINDAEYAAAMDRYNIAKQTDTLLTQQQRAQRDSLQAQIEGWQKMRELAQQLPQIMGQFRAGNLSNLSFEGRLAQQYQLFQGGLQTGNDPQGQLSAYLQQAQQIYGGATSQYSSLFEQALSQFQDKVSQGALDADALLPAAVRQANDIQKLVDQATPELKKAVIDTSDAQILALTGINTALTGGLGTLTTELRTWYTTVASQVDSFETAITNAGFPFLAPTGATEPGWEGGGSGGGYGSPWEAALDGVGNDFEAALTAQTTAVVDALRTEIGSLGAEVVSLRETLAEMAGKQIIQTGAAAVREIGALDELVQQGRQRSTNSDLERVLRR